MFEKMMKILSFLNLDTLIQGLLFLLLLLSIYLFIPSLALIFSPLMGISIISKAVYDFTTNREKIQIV